MRMQGPSRGGPSRGGSRSGGRFGSRDAGGRTGGRNEGGRSFDKGGKGDRFGTGPRFFRKKVCKMCGESTSIVDFKDTERLSKFLTEKGKILPRRITGNCAKHQRILARAIRRSRHSSLIAFQVE